MARTSIVPEEVEQFARLAADWWGRSPAELQAEIIDALEDIGAVREGRTFTM